MPFLLPEMFASFDRATHAGASRPLPPVLFDIFVPWKEKQTMNFFCPE